MAARGRFNTIYGVVRRVPRGRLATYGGIARLAGVPNGARTVGWALASLPDGEAVPWWRVVRSDGTIAPRSGAVEQRRRLARERIRFGKDGAVDLARYGWP